MSGSQLAVDPGLLTTLVFKLAVMAALATMLVRYRRFRHILIFERRTLPLRKEVRAVEFVTASPGVSADCDWLRVETQVHALKPSTVKLRYDDKKRLLALRRSGSARTPSPTNAACRASRSPP